MIRINPDKIPTQKIQQIIDAQNNQPDPEMGGLGYSFYRLSRIADDFVNMEELFDEILLPTVRSEIRKKLPPVLKVKWLVQSRIVRPLTDFGLLECRYKAEGDREIVAVRKTVLFDRFMRWEG